MITIIANFDVKPSMAEDFIKCATDLTRETRKERGCLSYKVMHERKNTAKFTFIEEWLNDVALEAHNNSKHFMCFADTVKPMLNKDIEITQYEKIPSVFF